MVERLSGKSKVVVEQVHQEVQIDSDKRNSDTKE